MKQSQLILLFLSLLLGFIACKSNEKENLVSEEELIKTELSKGIRRDTVFLNYVFGMDYLQVQNHKSKLSSSGILFEKIESFQPYDGKEGSYISFGKYNKVFVRHFCAFYKWKLSKVTAIIDTDDLLDMTLALAMFYTEKYGNPSIVTPSRDDGRISVHTWIEGNRKICIEPSIKSNELLVIYEDTSLYSAIKNDNKKENDSLKSKSKGII